MKSPILIAGFTTAPSNSAVSYLGGLGSQSGSGNTNPTTDALARSIMPLAGTFKNLRVRVPVAVTTGSYAFALMKNGVAQTLTCTISSGQVAFDNTNSFTVVAGDFVSLRITPTGTPTSQTPGVIAYSFVFETAGTEGIIFANLQSTAVANTLNYGNLGHYSNNGATLVNRQNVMPCAGTITGMGLNLTVAPGGALTRFVGVYKNNVLIDALTISGSSTSLQGNLGTPISFVAGDVVHLAVGGTSAVQTQCRVVLIWVPTNADEYPILSGITAGGHVTNVTYSLANGAATSTNTVEANMVTIAPVALDVIALRATITPAPGAGKSRTFTLRDELVDTTVTAQISASATSATWSGTYSLAAGDQLTMKQTPAGTPTAGNGGSSMVVKVPAVIALVVSADTSLTAADAITLAPKTSLTIANGVSASASDNLTIAFSGSNIALTVNAGVSLAPATTITLAPKTGLSVDNATSGSQTTSLAIVDHDVLTIENLTSRVRAQGSNTSPNLLDALGTDGTFTTGTGWTFGANWSATGGVAVTSAASNGTVAVTGTGDDSGNGLGVDSDYRITFDVVSRTAGAIKPNFAGNIGSPQTTVGTKVQDFIQPHSNPATGIFFGTDGVAFHGSIDNVVFQRLNTINFGASIPLTVAAATSAGILTTLTLAPKTALTVAGAASASSTDVPTLSPKTPLVISAAVSDSQADNITSSMGNPPLVLNAAVSASTAGNVTISAKTGLILASATSLGLADTPTLQPKTALVIDAAVSLTPASNVVLAQQFALLVNNLRQTVDVVGFGISADLITGAGSFDSATGWTLGTGWSIAGGVATAVFPADDLVYASATPTAFGGADYYSITIDTTTSVVVKFGNASQIINNGVAASFIRKVEGLLTNPLTVEGVFAGDIDNLRLYRSGLVNLSFKVTVGIAGLTSGGDVSNIVLAPQTEIIASFPHNLTETTSLVLGANTPLTIDDMATGGEIEAVTIEVFNYVILDDLISTTVTPQLSTSGATVMELQSAVSAAPLAAITLEFKTTLAVASLNSTTAVASVIISPITAIMVADAFSLGSATSVVLPSFWPLSVADGNSQTQLTGDIAQHFGALVISYLTSPGLVDHVHVSLTYNFTDDSFKEVAQTWPGERYPKVFSNDPSPAPTGYERYPTRHKRSYE